MNLICGFFSNLWNNFYNTCFRNLDDRTKTIVGVSLLLGGIVFFILSTKGSKKGEMVGSWFLFWISVIIFVVGLLYLTGK